MPKNNVLQTRYIPPPIPPRTLIRKRIVNQLGETLNYRLTLLIAGPGYGKSTTLTILATRQKPLIWYQITEEDCDPVVFLHNLCQATESAIPGIKDLPINQLENWESGRGRLPSMGILNVYLNALHQGLLEPTILVFDDAHLVQGSEELVQLLDSLLVNAPPMLHLFISSRSPIRLPNLARWQTNGSVLEINGDELAFTTEEIISLFSFQYDYYLAEDEARELRETTEGWPLTFPLIWQSLKNGETETVREVFTSKSYSLESLFDVLANDIVNKQTQDVRMFLEAVSILQVMTPQSCDYIRQSGDSASMLAYLCRQELFIHELPDGSFRFHNVFLYFLRQRADAEKISQWHRRAAEYFRNLGDFSTAVYHMLQSRDFTSAANVLSQYGGDLLNAGRLDTLSNSLDSIPPEILPQYPLLLYYMGELLRLRSRFHEALDWYAKAEVLWREQKEKQGVARALRGQARVYLDILDPSKAEVLLQQTLQFTDGSSDRESQARLYELLAENKLNSGDPETAKEFKQKAQTLWDQKSIDSQLEYRILMRTGKLLDAKLGLERRAKEENLKPVQMSRAHRETQLLLSLVYSFMGEGKSAYDAAIAGTSRGEHLNSPYVTVVGNIRQANALMLLEGNKSFEEVLEIFESALTLAKTFEIRRMQVSSLWGLSRVYGHQGNIAKAEELARESIEISANSGDEWVSSLIRITFAGSLILAGRYELASEIIRRAISGFIECNDPFGNTVANLWLSILNFRQSQFDALRHCLQELLVNCRQNGFEFLFTNRTLLGPPDPRVLVPVLIHARDNGIESATAASLLREIGIPDIQIHPGYQLKVFSLGDFHVWRGNTLIQPGDWRRESSRLLFQILLSSDEPLDREQLCGYLFPDYDDEKAKRNFKIALSTLFNVLEPIRLGGLDSSFIAREGSLYRIRSGADIWFDADEFLSIKIPGDPGSKNQGETGFLKLEEALAIYKGDYLPNARYENWAVFRREQLAVKFTKAADHLCKHYLEIKKPWEAINLCQRVLANDKYYEPAYRYLMLAYDQIGDKSQVIKTYESCQLELKNELKTSPAEQTTSLYKDLVEAA